MPGKTSDPVSELLTVRDWLRFGVSGFEKAGIAYGHGTDNAVDEAAFLILSTLSLPIDKLEPWLDCRLTHAEREAIHAIISSRIETRKPAPYLTKSAWIQGHKFYVDERVIVPRSYIGELLLRDGLAAIAGAPEDIRNILELCTGSGCLAVLAALVFPDATVTASDISPDALDVAKRNIKDYRLEDRISLLESDLFAAIPKNRFDLIIANPPYVTLAAVAAFPQEYRAEPKIAHLGGADGLDLVHKILEVAPAYLAPEGTLIAEIGQARDALEAARPDLPFLWLDTEGSEGEVFSLRAEDFEGVTPAKTKRK